MIRPRIRVLLSLLGMACVVLLSDRGFADEPGVTVLTGRMHHLRAAGPPEWSDFPAEPESNRLELSFDARANKTERTLVVRQQDVKQAWRVVLNDEQLGRLPVDENDMRLYFAVPVGGLKDGRNRLVVEQLGKTVDDVRIGEIRLLDQPRDEVLSAATIDMEVLDADSNEPLPSRITVINGDGALQTVGATSNDHLAVRAGVVFTSNGRASFGLPPGRYTIYAGRGFEYSLASVEIEVMRGQRIAKSLQIRREVPTEGWVASDTHLHTFTYSRHGDATIEERMITLAAEGIELPIATDHNQHIDYEPFARQLGVRRWFTPVMGNEVTTPVGHFNAFPVLADASPPDHKPRDWSAIFRGIYRTPDVKVVILNHARDLHSGVRPFGPRLHNAAVGESGKDWQLRANAMEVVNSGAVQTDVLQLPRDWMTMLNHGQLLTAVGGSDSHDVARHFVGQGRTYVRARDDDPAAISVDEAVRGFVDGRTMVSYGLAAELKVNRRYEVGELVPVDKGEIAVRARVLGPHWVSANKILLFANGELIREESIDSSRRSSRGVIWMGGWTLPRPAHDVHLVAIALGPGVDGLYWKTAKPYQPTSPEWRGSVLGVSGAVWLDGDGNGRKTPAIDYARNVVAESGGDAAALVVELNQYDAAVATQAAWLWQEKHGSLSDAAMQEALKQAKPFVQQGVAAYLRAARDSELARAMNP